MAKVGGERVLKQIVQTVEAQVDAEIEKLDNLEISDLEKIRKDRLAAMKKEAEQKEEWLKKGHGEYSVIGEKDFFEVSKNSTHVVVHFYKDDSERCKIFDHHLKLLAKKHIETRFIGVNAEKSHFLCSRLNIKVIPTLLIITSNILKDKIIGFTDLGNCDDFSNEMLEWRLALSQVIQYDGDLNHPPDKTKLNKKFSSTFKRSTIRDNSSDNSDSD